MHVHVAVHLAVAVCFFSSDHQPQTSGSHRRTVCPFASVAFSNILPSCFVICSTATAMLSSLPFRSVKEPPRPQSVWGGLDEGVKEKGVGVGVCACGCVCVCGGGGSQLAQNHSDTTNEIHTAISSAAELLDSFQGWSRLEFDHSSDIVKPVFVTGCKQAGC